MKGETGRRWSVALGRSKEGRKEVARADMCSDHSVSKLAFCGKGNVAKMHDPSILYIVPLFTCSSRFLHPVHTGLAECYSCRASAAG